MNNNNINNPIINFVDQILNKSISDVVNTNYTAVKPAVNIVDFNEYFSIQLAAPGLQKDNFNIEINENKLTISVETKLDGSINFTRKEYDYSSFKRSFTIPKTVDKTQIDAVYNLGILEIKLIKKAVSEEKIIKNIKIK